MKCYCAAHNWSQWPHFVLGFLQCPDFFLELGSFWFVLKFKALLLYILLYILFSATAAAKSR